jgi:shikimate dehydrogenase
VIVRRDGSLAGTNNDHYGFIENILDLEPNWRADAGPIVVIGAGGGARAVIYGLVHRGAREIRLINRTQARAEAVVREFGGPITVLPWEERHDALEGAAMLVNTTSQGMIGQLPLFLELDKLPVEALVTDIVYIPRETPLLEAARARGNRTVNGLGMLLHQGRPAWKAWFGIEPTVTPELRAMIEATL